MAAKVLILQVEGGLCNRVRTLSSADRWASATGRRLYYSWPVRQNFDASLDDLWLNPYRHISSGLFDRISRVVGGEEDGESLTVDDPRRLLVVQTGSILLPDSHELKPWWVPLKRLQPVQEVVDQVIETSEAWAGVPAVGVMIRAHARAHARTRQASPPEWFFERMNAMRAEDPELLFFLSTDSAGCVQHASSSDRVCR